MSTRPPDLGPAGKGELDNPQEPAGFGPASSGTLDTNIPIAPPREPQPLSPPREEQPVAGSFGGAEGQERRIRQDDPARWQVEERRSEPFHYEENPGGGSTRH
ncbi:MAG: hypothetical protein V4850_26970 [Myxococcota bacterium]